MRQEFLDSFRAKIEEMGKELSEAVNKAAEAIANAVNPIRVSIPGSEGSGGGGAGNFNNGGGGGAGGNYGNKIPEKSNDTGNQKPPRKRIRVTANIKDSYGNLTPLQEEFLASLQEYANTERIESIRRKMQFPFLYC